MKQTLLMAALSLLLLAGKPWPTHFLAYRFTLGIKDSSAYHGWRFITDSVHMQVEIDYVRSRVRIGETVIIYDSIKDCPNGLDNEKEFFRGLGTKQYELLYLDRRPTFPSGYRMLIKGNAHQCWYELQVLPVLVQ